MTYNTLLANSTGGLIEDLNNSWENAIDAVDYPVWIVPAYYKDETGDYVNANGETNTGRDKNFNLVVVDKLRNDDRQVISTVTDIYGSLSTASVYEELRDQLEEANIDHSLKSLFVSGNGGFQQLTVAINGQMNLAGAPDELEMRIRLDTSVDGSKAHTLTMIAFDPKNGVSYHLYGGEYKLSARHTNTINQRTYHFVPTIEKMIEHWNDTIMPMMIMMYDEKFERNAALEMLERLCEDAKIGERHITKISELYVTSTVGQEHNLYNINKTINGYFDEMDGKVELKTRFKDNLAKRIQREINKLKK